MITSWHLSFLCTYVSVCLSLSLVLSVCLTGCCFWWEIFTVVLFLQEVTSSGLKKNNPPLYSCSFLLYFIFDHALFCHSFFCFLSFSFFTSFPTTSLLPLLSPPWAPQLVFLASPTHLTSFCFVIFVGPSCWCTVVSVPNWLVCWIYRLLRQREMFHGYLM